MSGTFWSVVRLADRVFRMARVVAYIAGGEAIVMIAAIASFITGHYIIFTASATLAALILPVLALGYSVSAPRGSYLPRYFAWYKLTIRKVSWRLSGIKLFEVKDGRTVIGEFHCSFRVNRGKIAPKRLVLEFEGRSLPLHVCVQVGTKYLRCDEIDHIPAGSWLSCRARILKDEKKPDDGVTNHPTAGEFNNLFGPFELIFEADGYAFRHKFGPYELDMMIRGQEDIHHPPAAITPKLKEADAAQLGTSLSGDEAAKEQGSTEYIALNDAAMDAWERIRRLPEFDEPPPRLPFDSRREYYEADPVKMAGIVAQVIFNDADPPIPIKGISPPRTVMEVIPQDIARGYMFSDDATEMFDIYDQDKPAEQRRRYTNLRVKRTSIERRVKAIEEDNG